MPQTSKTYELSRRYQAGIAAKVPLSTPNSTLRMSEGTSLSGQQIVHRRLLYPVPDPRYEL